MSIELDGAPWRTVPSAVIADVALSVGTEITRPLARRFRTALRRREAIGHAERLLAHSARSVAALDHALAQRGVARGEREALVAELERSGLVSDSRSATDRAALLAERGWANAAIEHQLEAAGYAPQARSDALVGLDGELERARAALARKSRTPEQAARFLAQRGFDMELCESLFDYSDTMEG